MPLNPDVAGLRFPSFPDPWPLWELASSNMLRAAGSLTAVLKYPKTWVGAASVLGGSHYEHSRAYLGSTAGEYLVIELDSDKIYLVILFVTVPKLYFSLTL